MGVDTRFNNSTPSGMGIRQGTLNDCWLLAAEAGLANAVPNSLFNAEGSNYTPIITPDGLTEDGRQWYTVTFPGRGPVTIVFVPGQTYTDPTDATKQMAFSTNPGNGDWAAILEKAWAFSMDSNPNHTWTQRIKEQLDHIETAGVGINALTGRPPVFRALASAYQWRTRQILTSAMNAGRIVVADIAGSGHGLFGPHGYTVLGFNADNDTVHLRDPRGFTAGWTETVWLGNGWGPGSFRVVSRPPLAH